MSYCTYFYILFINACLTVPVTCVVTSGRPVGLPSAAVARWSSNILLAPQHTGNFFLNKECKFGQKSALLFIQLFSTSELIIVYLKYTILSAVTRFHECVLTYPLQLAVSTFLFFFSIPRSCLVGDRNPLLSVSLGVRRYRHGWSVCSFSSSSNVPSTRL